MTELAYEPSGYNAVSTYPRNPWNLDFITGGSSSGSAVAVASGAAVIAHRLGYRWIDSYPIALHGCHRMEAELGRGECRRGFAAGAVPRLRRTTRAQCRRSRSGGRGAGSER